MHQFAIITGSFGSGTFGLNVWKLLLQTQLNIHVVLFIHLDFVLFVLVSVLKALPLPSSMLTFLSSEVSSLL